MQLEGDHGVYGPLANWRVHGIYGLEAEVNRTHGVYDLKSILIMFGIVRIGVKGYLKGTQGVDGPQTS